MASRVYLLIVKGELNVKGTVYSRGQTPVGYWFTLVCAILGMALTLIMVALCIVDVPQRLGARITHV